MIRNNLDLLAERLNESSTLEGWCGFASLALFRSLKAHGIFCHLMAYQDWRNDFRHVWIEYENQIIDLTATQYGINQIVYVFPKTMISTQDEKFEYHRGVKISDDEMDEFSKYCDIYVAKIENVEVKSTNH